MKLNFSLIVYIIILPSIVNSYSNDIFSKVRRLPADISKLLDGYWHFYKAINNKTYTGKLEIHKRLCWEKSILRIYRHNLLAAAGHYNYTLRDNHISDLSTKEYIHRMVKLTPSRRRRRGDDPMVAAVLHDPRRIPTHLDWRKEGFVTAPVNQKDCGSCYAYSIAGTIEGQLFKRNKTLLPLSAQQLVDCSTANGNLGCGGGSLRNTLRYLEKSRGIMTQSAYPYKAKEGQCKYQEDLSVINITSWAILPARDEKALEAAVATIGPIAASVNASPMTFQLYNKGVYYDSECTSDVVNHAVLIVGYTPDEWILKNWWGENWGEGGYMRLRKNINHCGVANYASYAKV